jgi:hypothetical protein
VEEIIRARVWQFAVRVGGVRKKMCIPEVVSPAPWPVFVHTVLNEINIYKIKSSTVSNFPQ